MIRIRDYQPLDETPLAELYEQTVRRWAITHYTPEQVEAWATMPHDRQRFHDMLNEARTFVAVDASQQQVGFSGIDPSGRIASLYVAAQSTRLGIGGALLRHVIEHAEANQIGPLWSEASSLSRPLFERYGFATTAEEYVVFNGAGFKRWIVRRAFPCKHQQPVIL